MDLTTSLPPSIITSRFAGGSAKRRFLHGEKENSQKQKRGPKPVRVHSFAVGRPDHPLGDNRPSGVVLEDPWRGSSNSVIKRNAPAKLAEPACDARPRPIHYRTKRRRENPPFPLSHNVRVKLPPILA